jgi:hypothetical protein
MYKFNRYWKSEMDSGLRQNDKRVKGVAEEDFDRVREVCQGS